MKYTLKPDVVLATVLDESMLVTVSNQFNRIDDMRSLNETGAYFWRLMENGMEVEDIIAAAMRDYEITEDIARPAFIEFLKSLRDAGYITLEE